MLAAETSNRETQVMLDFVSQPRRNFSQASQSAQDVALPMADSVELAS